MATKNVLTSLIKQAWKSYYYSGGEDEQTLPEETSSLVTNVESGSGEGKQQRFRITSQSFIKGTPAVSAPPISKSMSEQTIGSEHDGFTLLECCCFKYVIPPWRLAYEWSGMFRLGAFINAVLTFSTLLCTVYATVGFHREMSWLMNNSEMYSSEIEPDLHNLRRLLPGFNSILAFGILSTVTTLFATILAILASMHARKRIHAAIIVSSFIHITLLFLSILFLLSISISAFAVWNRAPESTKGALGMLISNSFILGIPVQIVFVTIEFFTIFLKAKINTCLGKAPTSDIC